MARIINSGYFGVDHDGTLILLEKKTSETTCKYKSQEKCPSWIIYLEKFIQRDTRGWGDS
jgi:hypothetical protein